MSAGDSAVVSTGVPTLTEHLFRHEAGKLVSVLTGMFGIARLQLAEDVVQEALVRALQTWPYEGIPPNPPAWLMQTAKHLALDVLRREHRFQEKESAIVASFEARSGHGPAEPLFDDEIKDGQLRLIFTCCHPSLPLEAQSALALKTLCGFSPAEIAKAFLTSEAAIAKRLTRARQSLQEQRIALEVPTGTALGPRLDGVLQIVYLLFNEGYKASSGESLIREELCLEAIRLGTHLAEHRAADQPRTHALLALMLLDAARLPARTDSAGNIRRLQEQDRSLWNRALIARGIHHLAQAASGDEISEYHLQAGIAAYHCTAPDYASTNWRAILAHYDQWLEISDSPIVALNRAVALAYVEGAQAGILAVEAIGERRQLDSYYLTHAVLGDLEAQLQHHDSAANHFRRALQLTELKTEQAFFRKRLEECERAPATD